MAKKAARKKGKRKQGKLKQGFNRNLIWMAVVAVVGIGVAIFALQSTTAPPEVAASRLDLDPVMGNPEARVSIIEYGAYSCSSCRQLHQSGVIERLFEEYSGQVNFVFRDFPFITPQYDHGAAQIAQCVLDQDQLKFWQLHDLLYTEYYANRTHDQLVDLASNRLSLDGEQLATCYDQRQHYSTVQYDAQRGLDLGIRGTPTLYVNDSPVFSPTEANLRAAIDAALG